MKLLKLLLVVLIMSSCAKLKVHPNEKKSIYDHRADQLAWKGKVYEPSHWTLKYEDSEIFSDDKKAKADLEKANNLSHTSFVWLWGGAGLAIGYLWFLAPDNIDGNRSQINTYYWGLFGVGMVGHFYYQYQRGEQIKKTVNEYNKRNGYVFSPYIYRNDNRSNVGLGYATRF